MSKIQTTATETATKEVPEFPVVVKTLFKDPDAILKSLEASTINMVHASLGISSELAELFFGINTRDCENIKEEVGDYAFYLEAMRQAIDDSFEVEWPVAVAPTYDLFRLVILTGDLVDRVKKVFVYGDELKVVDCVVYIGEIEALLRGISDTHGFAYDSALDGNREKLWLKRYPEGYTDQAAIDRADKT